MTKPRKAARKPDVRERFMDRVTKTETCWLWDTISNQGGYGSFTHLRRVMTAHRWSYELFVGPTIKGMDICHRCDVRLCVRPDHLFQGTRLENVQDMNAKGRGKLPPRMRGEKHPKTRLKDHEVFEVRFGDSFSELSEREISKLLGVNRTLIGKIRRNELYIHVGADWADSRKARVRK